MHGDGCDRSVADQVVDEIERLGGRAVASHDSVASPEGGEAIVQAALQTFGRLDAVVSNAGIFSSVDFDQLTVEQWRRMLNVHLDGSFFLAQPAYKVMKAQGYGRFVFISSSAGMFGQPQEAHYAAAKAGIVGLGQGWLASAGTTPTAEDIEANLGTVSAIEPFIVPSSIFDEIMDIASRVGV
jgi:NAD(P)-dependent dehydrogenase (short-subunit alcohol dehydrogenase family)